MEVIGMIAEFDPFHRGHAHLIEQARAAFPGCPVVCAMSGSFTQRGGAAVASKYARAEMALEGGADLILELPVQWAAASAERFARGGVEVLAAAGVTRLVFGSEEGSLEPLRQAAGTLDGAGFSARLRPYLQNGLPFAQARQRALEELLGPGAQVLTRPNNLLGIEYLRAIRVLGAEMECSTFRRAGAGHDQPGGADGILSASALRALLLDGDFHGARAGMPSRAAEILERERAMGRCPAALAWNERGILTRLRGMSAAAFAALPDCGEGLENRLVRAAQEAVSLTEFYDLARSKRYAHSRVRRMALWAYLGLSAADGPEHVPYLRVLGLNQTGRTVLRRAKEWRRLPVVTKPAAVKLLGERCQRQFAIDAQVQRMWELCLPEVQPVRSEWRASPVVQKK